MAQADTPLHLLHVFSTFAVGGPQTRFVSLVNAMGGKYRHTVIAMDGNLQAAAGIEPQVDCVFEKMPVVKSGGISVANLRNARAILRRLKPGLLCTYNWGTIEWSLANRLFSVCPQVHVEDGFGPDEAPDRQHPRRALMRRFALSHCARVVVPSHVLEDVAVNKWHLPPARVLYLPNGIDCERFAAPADVSLLASLSIGENDLVIGTVAALRPEKNLQRLLRLFASLPPGFSARLVIVGDGPERPVLEQVAAQLGIADRVIMTGAMAAPEKILGRFNLFALSSDTEQMPNSVLEAMAAGLPVFATDVGDVKQMLAPENAPFVQPKDDEAALTTALAALLAAPEQRAHLGRLNRARVGAQYSLDTMVNRYAALYAAPATVTIS